MARKIRQGMTVEMLKESWGLPVPLAESEKLKDAKRAAGKSRVTVQPQTSPKVDAKKEKASKRFRRPVDSEANT
jgi:hypothetical protein